MKLNGSDIVMECLLEQGVDTVFGYPGGSILNIYDALYKYSDKITHILAAHEQGAAHAADGYARSSGRPGVVFATSGPGATNLVTGIATAYMDSVPLIAITCNVGTNMLGKDSFQEIDIVGVTMPITKHNFLVKKAENIADTIRQAFKIAQSGRPGPVLIDITKDATALEAEYEKIIPEKIDNYHLSATAADIKIACDMIKESERPLIYAGGGIISSGATEELKKFREMIDAPIALSLMGIGGFPATEPAFTGMIGMHGTKTSSLAVRDTDLIIAIGARFSDRVICNPNSFGRKAKILHIDVDRAEIDKNIKTSHHLLGDAKAVLAELNKQLTKLDHSEWMKQIYDWKKEFPLRHYEEDILTPQYVLEAIYELTNGEAIITTDVGQHQIWTAQFYKVNKPRRFISSGGLGTMGFGLGAAIGAQVANPDSKVINIAGDGCFHMNMNELSTAARYKIPVIEIVMNNNVLGMVRQWQRLFYGKRFSSTTLDKATDYDMLAKGFGVKGFTVSSKVEALAALKEALDGDEPVLINCLIDKDINVLPMVPAGQSIEEPILDIQIDD